MVEFGFQLPLAASSQKVVGSRVVELSWLVRFLPCGLLPKSGVGFEHFSCLVLGWPMAEKWDGFEHSVVRLAHGELLSSSPPLVNCFVPNVSLLRHSSSAHGWDKHGYNGSFF